MYNVVVVIPDGYKPETKDCPVCNKAFRDLEDYMCYKKWECCTDCDNNYRYPNKERWNSGWRPEMKTKEEDN